ncbi:hypothetical protein U9M48_022631 [Paspalum notatum var. saurae]|uniref:Uncharacterized protein n=1 Tax=Paspalum notatum var. saurae TaxID=547442 RepID=A0AAQ3TLE2_PASNO
MRRAPSPAMLLLLLLLLLFLGVELAVFTYSRRALKPNVAAAARKHGGAVLRMVRAPPGTAPDVRGGFGAREVAQESKRLVPQGPNPLHN